MTYKELLATAIKKARMYKKEEEALRFLLLEMSGLSSTEFYLQFGKQASESLIRDFRVASDIYIVDNIPIQHILGYSYFYGRKFVVNEYSFIPRNETEELVENVLIAYDEYFAGSNKKIHALDLGTGSGAIAITLALEEKNIAVSAADISEDALEVAIKNASKWQADVQFLVSDWFSNITGRFDIIVANPPYIPSYEELDLIVQKDPEIALYGGIDGTMFYEKILKEASKYLSEYGLIAFEHGYNQAETIVSYIKKYFPNSVIKTIKDMNDKERITLIGLGGVLK